MAQSLLAERFHPPHNSPYGDLTVGSFDPASSAARAGGGGMQLNEVSRQATGPFVAGVGLTHLRVYEQRPAPDGLSSGCAHVHALTDEAYYVVAGEGAIELHDTERGFRSVPLARGDFVQFPPGTLHRSVSTRGLEVLALMGNAGLAERGDARLYFGAEVDADPAGYERLKALPRHGGLQGALMRRDASVRAYQGLLRLWRDDRPAYFDELSRFIDLHRRDIAARRDEFVASSAAAPLAASAVVRHDQLDSTFGMCGVLRQFHAAEFV
jgi:mannose-6-phosphate isomerase-like protein (cupin superfamily)